jgi:hypothetical protein
VSKHSLQTVVAAHGIFWANLLPPNWRIVDMEAPVAGAFILPVFLLALK